MTIHELIKDLERLRDLHGGDTHVLVVGDYASLVSVEAEKVDMGDKETVAVVLRDEP